MRYLFQRQINVPRKKLSWLPNQAPDAFMQGEERGVGRVYHVKGWKGWSDGKKLKALREMAVRYGNDPMLRAFTINEVLRPAGAIDESRQFEKQAAAILAYVQNRIAYLNEPNEQLQSPWYTLRVAFGDCDDVGILIGAMCESIRLPWKFVLGGSDSQGNKIRWAEGDPKWKLTRGKWHHIYNMIGNKPFSPTHWYSAEGTMKVPLGYDVVMNGPPGKGRLDMGSWGSATSLPDVSSLPTMTSLPDTAPVTASDQEQFVVRQAGINDAQQRLQESRMPRGTFQFRRSYTNGAGYAGSTPAIRTGVAIGAGVAASQGQDVVADDAAVQAGQQVVQDEDDMYIQAWKSEGFRGIWRAIPWWGIGFAVLQGVIVTIITTRILEDREARRVRGAA